MANYSGTILCLLLTPMILCLQDAGRSVHVTTWSEANRAPLDFAYLKYLCSMKNKKIKLCKLVSSFYQLDDELARISKDLLKEDLITMVSRVQEHCRLNPHAKNCQK